jgi:hypothetical protein
MNEKALSVVEGLSVETSVRYDDNLYRVDDVIINQDEIDKLKKRPSDSGINIFRANSYFKVIDLATGEETNKFSPPLVFLIKFTSAQWGQALTKDTQKKYDRPRVAYLVYKEKNKKWDDKWVEFKEIEITKTTQPDTNGDPNGYLEITVKKLKDPLIGGC